MSPLLSLRLVSLAALLPVLSFNGCDQDRAGVAYGVLARDRIALTATASEIVTELPVPEGAPVTAGTVLVRLDDTQQAAAVAAAEAERARSKANLDKLVAGARPEERAIAQARVDAAQASFSEAEASLERSRQLLDRGIITQAVFDVETARRDAADAELDSARQALAELVSGAREEDIRIARAAVAAAEAQVRGARARLANLTVRASRDGILDSLPWNEGERVSQGSPVAVLLAGDVPVARVYVPEPYRVSLSVGDRLALQVDGMDGPLEGELRWISVEPAFTPYYALNQSERSRLVYLAEVALPESAASLPVGIPVEVQLP